MGRIRSIKPEFPQSESMGKVSREARLCFILLWTVSDDSGRTRGSSRMLASLLYPYDDDVPSIIDGWLSELESQKCIQRYVVDDAHYIQICKWSSHQKIDKPSKSKFPPPANPREDSTIPRERSSEDQGSRIKDQGGDQGSLSSATPPFDEFWEAYGKKVGRKESLAQWGKMSSDKRAEAIAGIPSYLATVSERRFQLDPVRYLKRERWNDEPVIRLVPPSSTPAATPEQEAMWYQEAYGKPVPKAEGK